MDEPARTIIRMTAAVDLMRDVDVGLERYIPEHCRDGFRGYIGRGAPVGDFLRAVLANDFSMALAHADDTNLSSLHDYMLFLYYHVPHHCWGSRRKYASWRLVGGLAGLCKEKVT
ncbi:MAG TPA: hypothetical protein ENH55_13445 [Aurantimonas coralicida]|uniref:Uncharacterized protein n=2 Tax=root TaxID=1 RepID=A0A9C9NE55_9HYPH|nr:hypothetical protein [Aurantimonas coralicida]HET99634.1 hypothetical protein [Aurantimonas coralicida]